MPHLDRCFQKAFRKEPVALGGAYIAGCHFSASECSSKLRMGRWLSPLLNPEYGSEGSAVRPIFSRVWYKEFQKILVLEFRHSND